MTASLYIHIPFCTTKCAYCDFFSQPILTTSSSITQELDDCNPIISHEFIKALCNEIRQRASQFTVNSWASVYIGGGTPSLLSASQLKTILSCVYKAAPLQQHAEVTIEANPESLTANWLVSAQQNGVNRLSLGIQSFNDEQLQTVQRGATSLDCIAALDCITSVWKGEFSVDLIAGLPSSKSTVSLTQGQKILEENIHTALKYAPHHISLYTLTIEEGTPLHTQVSKGLLELSDDDSDALWLLGRDLLESNGYSQYEVSNFARKGYEGKHNSRYWKCLPYIGCGPAACGTVDEVRYTNTIDVCFWQQAVFNNDLSKTDEIEMLSVDDRIFEYLFMGFRTLQGVNSFDFYTRFNKDITDFIEPIFSEWESKSLAHRKKNVQYSTDVTTHDSTQYALTKQGLLFLNTFCSNLA